MRKSRFSEKQEQVRPTPEACRTRGISANTFYRCHWGRPVGAVLWQGRKKEGAHRQVRPFQGLSVTVDGRPEARGEEAASTLSGEPRSEVRLPT